MSSQSDVARLRAEIAAQYDAAWRGMYGTSQGTSQHDFITARLDRMSELYDELKTVDKHAVEYLMHVMDRKCK